MTSGSGGRYQIEGNASGVVERCDPPTGFAATWEFGGEVSWIDVALSSTSDGTRLLLEHTAHVDDERWAEYGPGAVGVGWDLTLLGLALHLSTGASKEGQDIEAWSASDEGRSSSPAAANSWCEASIGAGTDRPAATAAAARTTAFYSGEPAPDDNAAVR